MLAGLSAYHIYKSITTVSYATGYSGIMSGAQAATSLSFGPAGVAALGLLSGHSGGHAAQETSDGVASGVLVGVLGIILSFVLGNHRFKIGTKVENSGEFWPNKARFRIKYGNEGESLYSTDVYFYGVASSSYRKDVKIYFPLIQIKEIE